jgi:hypothetical protein
MAMSNRVICFGSADLRSNFLNECLLERSEFLGGEACHREDFMHNAAMDLPIVCTLTEAELRQRRQTIVDTFRNMNVTITELPDGYAYTFAAKSEALMQVAQLVDLERQCCSFLTFKIVVEAGGGPMRVEVLAPKEAKPVILEYFNFNRT